MPFTTSSTTYQLASYASDVIEKSAPVGISKAPLDGHAATIFSSVGMYLHENGREICCSACKFTSSLLFDTFEIIAKHFTLQKQCPNNAKIKGSVLKKVLPLSVLDWSTFSNIDVFSTPDAFVHPTPETSPLETSAIEVLPFENFKMPEDIEKRSELVNFKAVNSGVSKTENSDSQPDKEDLAAKVGVSVDSEGIWTCLFCEWATSTDYFQLGTFCSSTQSNSCFHLQHFLLQHSLFSVNCSSFEKKADFDTKGIIKSASYRSLKTRVSIENTKFGPVLCFMKQPVMDQGLEIVHLFLFRENLSFLHPKDAWLLEVYKVVQNLERQHEIKFFVPLRSKETSLASEKSSKQKIKQTKKDVPQLNWFPHEDLTTFSLSNDWKAMVQKRDSYLSTLTCGLCFEPDDLYINLGCGHVMLCFQCILRMPQLRKTCPICRTSLNAVQKLCLK